MLEGLLAVVLCPNRDLLRIGLTLGLFCVCARGRAILFGATDFLAVAATGVFSGVIDGVILPVPLRRTAYGSAVAGLVSSGRGRIGPRRTVPLIKEPVPAEFFRADLVDSPDMAEGGRAGPEDAVDAVEVVLAPRDFDDTDLTGEYVAAADMGRSGTFEAAILALRCSAIFSFRAFRAAPAPTDFENEEGAALLCDDAREPFGLLGSFSSAVFSRFSSVSNIASAL
jgi:hypothetical protein